MGLFKNKVGRPSNDTIKRRRIIATVMIFAVVLAIGVCVFYTVNYFKNSSSVSGTDKNATAFWKAVPQISSSTSMRYDRTSGYGSQTIKKNKFTNLESRGVFLLKMDKTATLKIKTQYLKNIAAGVKNGSKKAYYSVQVEAYDSNGKLLSSSSKTKIKKQTITQSLKVKNTVSSIKIKVYGSIDTNYIVKLDTYNVGSYNISKNLNDTFTTPGLRKCVLKEYRDSFKQPAKIDLTDAELAKLISLKCNKANIVNTKGIEKLSGLKSLDLDYNEIEFLDLTKNKSLTTLSANENKLKELIITNNEYLRYLSLVNNQLTKIDVTKNKYLIQLILYNNRLESINLKENKELQHLDLSDNRFKSIDLSKNKELKTIYLANEVSKNGNGNDLKSLDLRNNTKLERLAVFGNKNLKNSNIKLASGISLNKILVSTLMG